MSSRSPCRTLLRAAGLLALTCAASLLLSRRHGPFVLVDRTHGRTRPPLRYGPDYRSLTACVDELLAAAALPAELPRVAILDGDAPDDIFAPLPNASSEPPPALPLALPLALLDVLVSGGWDVLLLSSDRSLTRGWEGALPAWSAARPEPGLAERAPAVVLLRPHRAACAAAHGHALLGVAVAARAAADTLLWLRHWRGARALAEWPRYYAPSALLPRVAAARDAARLLHHFAPPQPWRCGPGAMRQCICAHAADRPVPCSGHRIHGGPRAYAQRSARGGAWTRTA